MILRSTSPAFETSNLQSCVLPYSHSKANSVNTHTTAIIMPLSMIFIRKAEKISYMINIMNLTTYHSLMMIDGWFGVRGSGLDRSDYHSSTSAAVKLVSFTTSWLARGEQRYDDFSRLFLNTVCRIISYWIQFTPSNPFSTFAVPVLSPAMTLLLSTAHDTGSPGQINYEKYGSL
jgi:hypothetical protein